LDILMWLREKGCKWNESTFESAAVGKRITVMKWAREMRCPWDENAGIEAAKAGNPQGLKWLRENGCPWNAKLICFHLIPWYQEPEKVIWALENGGGWDDKLCARAAGFNSLQVLKWAEEKGLSMEGLFPVLANSSLKIQEWAKENGLWVRAGLVQEEKKDD